MVQVENPQAKQEAVAPDRFAAAKTYAQFLGTITQNQQKFADNYAKTQVPAALVARVRLLSAKAGGPAKVVLIGEDWCPDVYRGLPVLQRLAEAAGWDLRVLERDQNLDVAEQFKKDGEFLSIPTVIFYTQDGRYLTHWIERPAQVTAEMATSMRPLYAAASAGALAEKLGREPTEAETGAARAEMQQRVDAFQASSPAWASWRELTLADVIAQLEQATA